MDEARSFLALPPLAFEPDRHNRPHDRKPDTVEIARRLTLQACAWEHLSRPLRLHPKPMARYRRALEKRPGFGRFADDQRRSPKAYFATAGLFALDAAWPAGARNPRLESHRLESRAQQPPARFGGRGGQKPSDPYWRVKESRGPHSAARLTFGANTSSICPASSTP